MLKIDQDMCILQVFLFLSGSCFDQYMGRGIQFLSERLLGNLGDLAQMLFKLEFCQTGPKIVSNSLQFFYEKH